MESVVGPLLVEEPLEVTATAGGESLRRVRERGVWVKRATTQSLHIFTECTYLSQLTEFCTNIIV